MTTKAKTRLAASLRGQDQRQPPTRAPGSGGDKKPVIFRLEPEVVYQLKSLALEKGKPMQALLCDGLNKVFIENNLPPIAK